jgi:hypothetical protein
MAITRLLARLRDRGAPRGELIIWAAAGGAMVGLVDQITLRLSPVLLRLERFDALHGRAGHLSLYEFHHVWTAGVLALISAVLYGALAAIVYRIA